MSSRPKKSISYVISEYKIKSGYNETCFLEGWGLLIDFVHGSLAYSLYFLFDVTTTHKLIVPLT
jgi:hypothetical protein